MILYYFSQLEDFCSLTLGKFLRMSNTNPQSDTTSLIAAYLPIMKSA